MDTPGAREYAIATRPLPNLLRSIDAHEAAAAAAASNEQQAAEHDLATSQLKRIVIVGAGAAGIELACAFRERLRLQGRPVPPGCVTVVHGGDAEPLAEVGSYVSHATAAASTCCCDN